VAARASRSRIRACCHTAAETKIATSANVASVGSVPRSVNRDRAIARGKELGRGGGLDCTVMKAFVMVMLAAIIVALFTALVFLFRDRGHGTRMVTALTIRVGLSVALVAFLVLSYYMGWISPRGMR